MLRPQTRPFGDAICTAVSAQILLSSKRGNGLDSETYHSKVLSRDATGEGYVVDVAVYCTLFAEQLGLAVVDVARGLLVEGGTPRPYRGRD